MKRAQLAFRQLALAFRLSARAPSEADLVSRSASGASAKLRADLVAALASVQEVAREARAAHVSGGEASASREFR